VRVSKWIAYHGFSLNIKNSLNPFKSIVPCGISDRGVTNLKKISEQNYEKIQDILIEKFLTNLKSLNA
jgi:lipoyl(octanoyl) transferase